MSLLLNSVTVSDTTSKYFNSKVNILIDSKGTIKKISKNKISDKVKKVVDLEGLYISCLLYTSPSPRDNSGSRMPSSA